MNNLTLKPLNRLDLDEIVSAFQKIGWHKPKSLYETYLDEQLSGLRSIIIAIVNEKFCGYVTIKWKSDYSSFAKQEIPEIVDLNVLPEHRKKGIGTKLIQACERLAKERSKMLIGLSVGLTADYGSAQRLYVQLGYIPDGRGLYHKNITAKYGKKIKVDDDLVIYLTKIL